MADTTPCLALPLLAAGQAQKELFHNEALIALDFMAQATAETLGDTVPPDAPVPGQAWIVGAAPSGAWTGQAGAVAGWTDGGWRFFAPREGMRLWVRAAEQFADRRGEVCQLGGITGATLTIGGVQVVGAQQPAIASPPGGATVDQVRTALDAVLDALRAHGLIAR